MPTLWYNLLPLKLLTL